MPKIKKILVRGTNWIGDAVMQIPALRALRRVFPDARISLHTRDWARGIFEDADFIDEILEIKASESKIKTVLAQSKNLRKQRFDLAVLFPNSFESALIAKLARIPERFGYAKDARSFLLTDAVKIPVWKNERHEAFYYLNLIGEIEKKHFGKKFISEEILKVDLPVSDARKIAARRFLEENKIDLSKKIVALGVGSTNSRAKRWQAEKFAALNDQLQSESNANVVLVGAKNETDVSEKVFSTAKIKPKILTGKTNLAEATAILSVADLFVGNDMGLAHVAAAVGAPTLVIFGPTNERTTQPLGSAIIRKQVECAPCMLRDCPIDHRCMTRISATEVYEKSKEMLDSDYVKNR